MIKALLVASLLFSVTALAHESSSSTSSAKKPALLARGGASKKKPTKPPEKPPEKAVPEGARSDPRTAQPEAAPAPAAPGGEARRGMSRIEFDDRLVQGQTNKANAIYLFERRESALRSLLKKRTDFHEEIDETLE